MNLEDLPAALVEIAPSLDPVDIAGTEDNLFFVTFEDGAIVTIAHDALRETLVLSAELGPAKNDESQLKFCQFFMQFNTQWDELGGLRFGCDHEGAFHLFLDLPSPTLTPEKLVTFLRGVAERQGFWRGILGGSAPERPEDDIDESDLETLMRV